MADTDAKGCYIKSDAARVQVVLAEQVAPGVPPRFGQIGIHLWLHRSRRPYQS